MKTMLRIGLLTGFALLAVFCVAGCGSKEDPTMTAAPPPAANATPAAPAAQKNMPERGGPGAGPVSAPATVK